MAKNSPERLAQRCNDSQLPPFLALKIKFEHFDISIAFLYHQVNFKKMAYPVYLLFVGHSQNVFGIFTPSFCGLVLLSLVSVVLH